MIIKTKKYKIPHGLYVSLGLQNILRMQWWVVPLLLFFMSGTFVMRSIWFVVGGLICFSGYIVFWMIQFYALTQLEENRPMFEKIVYEINHQQLIMQINPKQGMPISWAGLIKAYKRKHYFLLVRSKVQFFYLPFKIFNGDSDIKFFTAVLQRKGLLK